MSVVHGTVDGYRNHGCRCDPCRDAGSKYLASQKTLCPGGCGRRIHGRYRPERMCIECRAKAKTKPLEHGTETGYKKGCRCGSCTAAATTARLERKHRRR